MACDGVYAAGDATAYPIKHGGIAAQQADVVAAAIAARAGAAIAPQPLRPLIRGVLMTGGDDGSSRPSSRRRRLHSTVSDVCPWDPPTKIAARHLGPYLAHGDRPQPRLAPASASRRARVKRRRPAAGRRNALRLHAAPRSTRAADRAEILAVNAEADAATVGAVGYTRVYGPRAELAVDLDERWWAARAARGARGQALHVAAADGIASFLVRESRAPRRAPPALLRGRFGAG